MKRAIVLAAIVCVCQVLLPGAAGAQGRYQFKSRVYKLDPFFTDYQPPDKKFLAPWVHDALRRVDLTDLQTPVKDQGQRGSCAYFTATALVEHAILRSSGGEQALNLSEEYMVYYAKAVLGQSSWSDGSYVQRNLDSVRQSGLLREEDMPYTHSWFLPGMPCQDENEYDCNRPECFSHLPPYPEQADHLIAPGAFHLEIRSNCKAAGCSDKLDWIVRRMRDRQAVTLAVPLHQDGWDWQTGEASYTEAQAKFCEQNPYDGSCGAHAILLTGYDMDRRVFRFKNSWGADWGRGGYGTIDFTYVDRYSQRNSIRVAALADLDPDIANGPLGTEALQDFANEIVPEWVEGDETGVLVRLMYAYDAPVGTFSYASAFLATSDGQGNYELISYPDHWGNLRYVAARLFGVALSPEDLVRTTDNPLTLFVPYSLLTTASVSPDMHLVWRLSFYRMSDSESYGLLDRVYVPFELPPAFLCQAGGWIGACSGGVLTTCDPSGQVVIQDCSGEGMTCGLDEQTGLFTCR